MRSPHAESRWSTMKRHPKKIVPVLAALLLPFATCGVQWLLWDTFRPFVWFLFYPAVFFSSRIGGRPIGIVTTVVSALLVVYCFIPPQLSLFGKNPSNLPSVLVFLAMGILFSYTHERLERATLRAGDAQEAARIANEQLQRARIELLQAEKQLAEESLVRSEERFRHLFTRAPVPLCFVTRDGVVTDINARFLQMFGYDKRDIPNLERWWAAAYPDESYRAWVLATWSEAVRKAVETGEDIEPIEYRVTCKDGASRIVLISGIMLDGDVLASFFDVTGRRLAEDALQSSEWSLRQAQRLAKVGNWSWDLKSGDHRWSEEIYRIYGRDPQLPPAVYPEVAQYFTPAGWERLSTAVERGLATGTTYECDAEVARADGTPCWIVARGYADRNEAGEVVRLYGTVQEITDRKLAEKEIRALNAGLERRVEERTAELLGANRELDAFAYAVAHDLRAPLRAMIGFSEALVEDYGERLDGEARDFLEQIVLASRNMGGLIDGLLMLSRTTRGELRRERVDLSAMTSRLREDLERGEPGRRVEWEIAAGVFGDGDFRMLEVVMRNLIGNAWKYTAHTASPRIVFHARECDGRPLYVVEDNGAGFDVAHSERLFKPFQRLHRQDEFTGIGIGLATVQRIVHRHGGSIRAEGVPGGGAIFRFSLSNATVKETV